MLFKVSKYDDHSIIINKIFGNIILPTYQLFQLPAGLWLPVNLVHGDQYRFLQCPQYHKKLESENSHSNYCSFQLECQPTNREGLLMLLQPNWIVSQDKTIYLQRPFSTLRKGQYHESWLSWLHHRESVAHYFQEIKERCGRLEAQQHVSYLNLQLCEERCYHSKEWYQER